MELEKCLFQDRVHTTCRVSKNFTCLLKFIILWQILYLLRRLELNFGGYLTFDYFWSQKLDTFGFYIWKRKFWIFTGHLIRFLLLLFIQFASSCEILWTQLLSLCELFAGISFFVIFFHDKLKALLSKNHLF